MSYTAEVIDAETLGNPASVLMTLHKLPLAKIAAE